MNSFISRAIEIFVSANNVFKKWSTWAIFIILLIFGLAMTLDTFLPAKEVYYGQNEAKIESKANSTYSSYNGVVSTSKYFSTVLHFDNYSLLLGDLNQISMVNGLLRKGEIMFRITPVFGQVKTYIGEVNEEIISRNFVYTWCCYAAALFFILIQLLTKEKSKVFEYLFSYIAIFLTLYILFYI